MKYAVIRTGGKQYRINEGDVIDVERLPLSADKSVTFSDVLLVADGDAVTLGEPLVSGMSVLGTIIDDIRGEKIRVAKFKAKARYRRVTGHRQALTRVQINTIGSATKAKKAVSADRQADDKGTSDKKVTTSATEK